MSKDQLTTTITGAAELLDVSRTTVKELIRDGTLSSVKLRGCRRILLADLKAMLRKKRRTGK